MRIIFQLLTVFFFQLSMAQAASEYATVDAKMAKIPENLTHSTTDIARYISTNFTSESDKIRAAFYWTASALSYDVENMNEPNFIYSPQEKIENALKTRKGVCIHYAEVFSEIARKIGIKTYIIGGYVKQNGKIPSISHAWCGAKVDGKWLLFDPTWASGYVNNEKFVKRFNNMYYKMTPEKALLTHMPFDYMWQFLNSPITNREFYSGILNKERLISNYDFPTEIARHEQLPDDQKAFETAQRVEKNGVINNLISDFLANRKNEFTVLRQNKNIEKLNEVVANFNEGVALLNNFIDYRNNKFKPALPDEEILLMIQNPLNKLKKCQDDINKVGTVGKENSVSVNSLRKSIIEATKQAKMHNDFVKDYLSKNQNQRKSMFSKTTFFGVPLN